MIGRAYLTLSFIFMPLAIQAMGSPGFPRTPLRAYSQTPAPSPGSPSFSGSEVQLTAEQFSEIFLTELREKPNDINILHQGATYLHLTVDEAIKKETSDDEFNGFMQLISRLIQGYNADPNITCYGTSVRSLIAEAEKSSLIHQQQRAQRLKDVIFPQTLHAPQQTMKPQSNAHNGIVEAQPHKGDVSLEETHSILSPPLFWGLCTLGIGVIGLGIVYIVSNKGVELTSPLNRMSNT